MSCDGASGVETARIATKLMATWYIHCERPLSRLYATWLEKIATRNGSTANAPTRNQPSTVSHVFASLQWVRMCSVKSPDAPGA